MNSEYRSLLQLANRSLCSGDVQKAKKLFTRIIDHCRCFEARTDSRIADEKDLEDLEQSAIVGRIKACLLMRDSSSAKAFFEEALGNQPISDQQEHVKLLAALVQFCAGDIHATIKCLETPETNASANVFSLFLRSLWELVDLWYAEMDAKGDEIEMLNEELAGSDAQRKQQEQLQLLGAEKLLLAQLQVQRTEDKLLEKMERMDLQGQHFSSSS